MRISDWSSDVCSSDLLADADDATLLDIGIGTGQQEVAVLRALAAQDRLPRRLHIVGIEPGPSMLADAERSFAALGAELGLEIGRASCRERVCKYVSISVVAVSLKKKTKITSVD